MPPRPRRPATAAETCLRCVLLADHAPAKVNLTLRVLGRRADGYHELESLVVFADVGDRLSFAPGGDLALTVRGPTAAAAGAGDDNLVLKAARALAARRPGPRARALSSSTNGCRSRPGSAAARPMRRRRCGCWPRANGIARDDARLYAAARATGADVPVCLDPRPRMMRGIGEDCRRRWRCRRCRRCWSIRAWRCRPRRSSPAGRLRRRLRSRSTTRRSQSSRARANWSRLVAAQTNDLEPPAIALQPAIARRAGGVARTSRLRAGAHVRLGRDLLWIVRHAPMRRQRRKRLSP